MLVEIPNFLKPQIDPSLLEFHRRGEPRLIAVAGDVMEFNLLAAHQNEKKDISII